MQLYQNSRAQLQQLTVGLTILTILSYVCATAGWQYLWGLSLSGTLPLWAQLVGIALIIILGWTPFLDRLPAGLIAWGDQLSPMQKNIAILSCLSAVFISCLLLKYNNFVLGDAFSIVQRLSESMDFAPYSKANVFLHNLIFDRLNFESEPIPKAILTYRLTSFASAFFALAGIFVILKNNVERAAILVCLISSGILLVFCGYVERYPLTVAAMLLYCITASRDFKSGRLSVITIVLLALSLLTHLGTAVLLPSFLYLSWSNFRTKLGVLILGIGAIVAAVAGLIIGHFSEFLAGAFVPLFAKTGNPYSLLSTAHLSDLLNVLLLSFPLFLLVPIFRKSLRPDERSFQILSVLPGLLFLCVVDCKLGAIRDWDLLSFALVPVIVLIGRCLVAAFESDRICLIKAVMVILVFALLHTGSWVRLNFSQQGSYEAIKNLIANDVHYSPDYNQGFSNIAWAKTVQNTYMDGAGGVSAQERRLAGAPEDALNRYNLASNLYRLGNKSRAAEIVRGHWQNFHLTPKVVERVAGILRDSGDREELIKLLETAINTNSANEVFRPELDKLKLTP